MPRLTSDELAIGLAFIVLATLACLAPAQGDTWWLLRAGQDIWSTGRVPLVETYSHTAAGRPWPNHEWLTEAVFYGLHRLGGMPLLAAVCATAATSAWAISYSLTRGAFEPRFIVLLGSLVTTSISFALRPQMFTMLFFALTCLLLIRDRLVWIPAVVLVWANFHGAVALGLVAIAAAFAGTLIGERRWSWPLAWTGLASALATLVTPLGTDLWMFWLQSPARSGVNAIVEWRPPGFAPSLWPFWAIAALLAAFTVGNRRHLDADGRRIAAIALGVLPLALLALRNVPIFMLAALPAVTQVVAARARSGTRAVDRDRNRVNGALVACAAVAAAVVVTTAWTWPPAPLGWRPLPSGARSALAACDGPLFNTYADGGMLTWFVPERPVFVDSRQDPYPADLLAAAREAEFSGDYGNLFSRYRIGCAILPAGSPLATRIDGDAGWAARYSDRTYRVVARTRQ